MNTNNKNQNKLSKKKKKKKEAAKLNFLIYFKIFQMMKSKIKTN